MDTIAVMAFNLIKQIDDEFKQFTGSHHAFACMVLQQYGVRVDFLKTPFGITVSVDYDDIIRLFEKEPLPSSIKNPTFTRQWT
jgi:hypothetical protein